MDTARYNINAINQACHKTLQIHFEEIGHLGDKEADGMQLKIIFLKQVVSMGDGWHWFRIVSSDGLFY
jgi:hypothetical protein